MWGVFIGLTIVMTWPNVLYLATRSVEHQDIFFNLWRLRWVQHALSTSPTNLFNGNQFHPETAVLAYSDAMLLEALIAFVPLSIGVPPMLVHNLLLLGAIAASGIGMFVLARYLWGSTLGALIAGIIFAFAPYRFAHFMHMELQWTIWMPWAFWALQRVIDSGRPRFGILTGVFVALQFLSSIYYGLFLVVLLALVGGIQVLATLRRLRPAALASLFAGALIVAGVAWVYSIPYRAASTRVGLRSTQEILRYSATPASYLRVPEMNRLYGHWRAGSTEVSLYPGLLPVLLGVFALAAMRPTRTSIAYGAGALVAFDLSLGLNGLLYPYLQQHVGAFKGLRAPSRASIFFLLFLGALAARAAGAVSERFKTKSRRTTVAAAFVALVLVEYWSAPMRLIPYPNRSPLFEFLAGLPPGVVAEFPVPRLESLPADDARYLYLSTFHWKPIVNGYSGYYPPTYIERLIKLKAFPSPNGMRQLRWDKVRYIIVHEERYYLDPPEGIRVIEELVRLGATPIIRLSDGWAPATLLELPPEASR